MPQKLDPSELATFKELLIATMIETQTRAQLLMKKGIIGQQPAGISHGAKACAD